MAIYFDTKLLEKAEQSGTDVYAYEQASIINYVVSYIINSKVRESVRLSKWLNDNIDDFFPYIEYKKLNVGINAEDDFDAIMLKIVRFVKKNIRYIGDKASWQILEYWQTPIETWDITTGDCEDGAILMYALARYYNVPKERLMLWCGEVVDQYNNSGGHCCLMYKPIHYPLDWFALDWCFYPSMILNTYVQLSGTWVKTYTQKSLYVAEPALINYYYKTWFMFNEDKSYTQLKRKYR